MNGPLTGPLTCVIINRYCLYLNISPDDKVKSDVDIFRRIDVFQISPRFQLRYPVIVVFMIDFAFENRFG